MPTDIPPPPPHHGLVLVSHLLCPYVQRAAIVLAEKGLAFTRIDIDLSAKPAWFLAISPLGKTPVLLVDGVPLFESAVICEYLDETALPALHPGDALQRARERAWMEFGSAMLNEIALFYNAPDAQALADRAAALHRRCQQLESALGEGPWFAGRRFGLVDAVFGPVMRYFDVFDRLDPQGFGVFDGLPRVQAWRRALAQRPSVRGAVAPGYGDQLRAFLLRRGSALAQRVQAVPATA